MSSFFKKHPYLTVSVLASAVYIALYRGFLLGGLVYMYSDVGSDSLGSSYPIITMLSRHLREGDFSFYHLESGLGADTTATFLQYINPIKLFLLLFGRDRFPEGVLAFMYLVHLLTALFSCAFFASLLGYDAKNAETQSVSAVVLPSLIWTYSAYMVLWGQNYSFSVCMLMFTASMAALERYLARPGRRRYILLVLVLALTLISNYYFFYMTGIFAAFYTLFRVCFTDAASLPEKMAGAADRFRVLVKRECLLLLAALLCLCTAACAVLPIVLTFLGSARAGDAVSGGLRALLAPYPIRTLLTFIARSFSSSLMGAGPAYTGAVNYYESAVIATSGIVFSAALYLLFRRRYTLQTFLCSLASMLLLIAPISARLLTMAATSQRHSFYISFMGAVATAFFLKDILARPSDSPASSERPVSAGNAAVSSSPHVNAALVLTAPLAALISLFALYVLKRGQARYGYTLDLLSLRTVCIFLILFAAVLLLIALIRPLRPYLGAGLCLIAACEIILVNSPALYDRIALTKEDYETGFYNDGTGEAVESVKASDDGLYRILASSAPDFANEGLVDDYLSASSYSNTAPASIVTLSDTFGVSQISSNFFTLDYGSYYLYTLLSGKYLITDDPDNQLDAAEPSMLRLKDESETNRIFENENTLPFGYVYDTEWTGEDIAALSYADRARALTQGYVLTEDLLAAEKTELQAPPVSRIQNNPADSSATVNLAETDAAANPAETDAAANPTDSSAAVFLSAADKICPQTVEDLVGHIYGPSNVSLAPLEEGGVAFTVTGPDPYVFFDLSSSKSASEADVQFLSLMADTTGMTGPWYMEMFLLTDTHPDLADCVDKLITVTPGVPAVTAMLPDGMNLLRLDFPEGGGTYTFTDLSLITAPAGADFTALSESAVSNITFKGSTYRAHVAECSQGDMLCIPLLYTKNFHASVNGVQTPVLNINGGLCGIPLQQGDCDVIMTYTIPYFRPALMLSLMTLILLLLFLALPEKRRKE